MAISGRMIEHLQDEFSSLDSLRGFPQRALKILTARELDVLLLLMLNAPNREIATGLSIAVSTVNIHVPRILDEFGLAYREEVGNLARRLPVQIYLVDSRGQLRRQSTFSP
jgi:DNA-binding CsgD family transcriptional regulator